MSSTANTTVRMFGLLHTFRKDRGLPSQAEVVVPEAGCPAATIARELGLPMEKIEAVFVNHKAYALEHEVHPGDQVAFVPTGVPGPGRMMLGIRHAQEK